MLRSFCYVWPKPPVMSYSADRVFEKHKPLTTVDYEQQLDYITEWVNEWGSTERFVFIEKLLWKCEIQEVQLLWTVLQPTLHRDFVFSSLTQQTNGSFSAISIPITREVHRNARYSKHKDDVRAWTSCSVLPIMKYPIQSSPVIKMSYTVSPELIKSGSWKSPRSYVGSRFPGIRKPLSIKSAPAQLSSVQNKHYLLRRHMQEREKAENLSIKNTEIQDRVKSSETVLREMSKIIKWFNEKWDDWKRSDFLHTLLKILDASEFFYISGLIAVRQYRDFISLLPRTISLRILSFLQVEELALISLVCRAWNIITNDSDLWKYKCTEIYVGVEINKTKHWKTVYKESLALRKNWQKGHCTILQLSGHTKRVLVVSAFENLVASGSSDRTISIWDCKAGKLLQTVDGHSKGVWCLSFISKTILISASHDSTIRIWNLQTNTCVKILLGHRGPVWAMARKSDVLVTGSGDKTAKVWNIHGFHLLHNLVGHSASIFCVDIDDESRKVFTGSADHSVRIWNLDTGRCIRYFYIAVSGLTNTVTSLSYDQGYLLTASGTSVLLWDIANNVCIREFIGHEDRVESVKLKIKKVRGEIDHGIVYGAGKDEAVKYWDFHSGTLLRTLRHNMGSVNSVFVDESRIIAGSDDNKIHIWNFLPRITRNQRKNGKLKTKPT